jgi:hypothetical protein
VLAPAEGLSGAALVGGVLHQILVVSTDVPPQDGETYEQHQERENATLPELFGDNKSSLLLPQVQVHNQFNNRLTHRTSQ